MGDVHNIREVMLHQCEVLSFASKVPHTNTILNTVKYCQNAPSWRARKSKIDGGQIHCIAQLYCESTPWNWKLVIDMPLASQLAPSLYVGFLGEVYICSKPLGNTLLHCHVEFERLSQPRAAIGAAHLQLTYAYILASEFLQLDSPRVNFFVQSLLKALVWRQVDFCLFNSTTTLRSYVDTPMCKYKVAILTRCACADVDFASQRGGAYTISNLSDAINEGGRLHGWRHSDGTLRYSLFENRKTQY